ncbi:MAG: DUF4097 domain-containing protein [Gammaproteobacteria bacterium]|nr:MAG: DUF4097 domain-containing protein [Gammaproteobacteria bacterium]
MRLVLGSLLLLSTASAFAHNCANTAERKLDIDPAGLKALRFELGSNDIKVQGVPGLQQIEVRGRACASDPAWLAELDMTQSRVGDKVVVKPLPRPQHNGFFNSYAYIDFEVRLPAALPLEVGTGSGDANISDVAALDFDTGSGDLKLTRVTGVVNARVGSGDIVANDVGSFVLRSGGSGDVTANGVRGDVKIGHVGSGDLHFVEVKGGVQIDAIGSGDVAVDQVGGDMFVGSIGSGDVVAKNVTGNFTVKAAGSGDIHHSGIGGKVEVPARHQND